MPDARSKDVVRFDGRVLFLSQDPRIVERQLRGEEVTLEEALPLRTDVSTDEITPAWIWYYFDEKLGEYPYLGLKCGDTTPVAAGKYVSPMIITSLERESGGNVLLHEPSGIVCFADHLTFIHRSMPRQRRALGPLDAAQAMAQVQQRFCEKHGSRLHGFLKDREGSEGISHSIMAERYVRPGQLAVGTDSHTPYCGALGALAFGIGATEMANAWMTGEVRIQVPKTCRVRLNGRLAAGVEAKDIVLHLLRLPYVREGRAIGQVVEYCGEALTARCPPTNVPR